MLVKIKTGDQTLEFDSTKNPIAILFTPKDKEHVENMRHDELLLLSAPLKDMRSPERIWHWAYNDWKGAKYISPEQAATQTQLRR